jgi:hydroxymethylpyrimidine pyrophosphatase-like HAD family hydrolase
MQPCSSRVIWCIMHEIWNDGHAQRRIRLVATDIDGTLLNSENMLPAANRRALAQALEQGVQIALVTARKRSSTYSVAATLGIPCACIAHNGARAWDWDDHEIRHLVVDLALAQEIARFADRHAIPLILTIDEVNYYSPAYPFNAALRGPDDRQVASSLAALSAPPTRVIVTGKEGVDLLCDVFGSAPDSVVVHRYYSREGAVASAVLTHPRATKEDALADLVQRIGIQAAEVLALGDAEADAGMLRWAGVGVAMGNAMPEAREVADWIAPTHDEAGLAVALERFVLGPGDPEQMRR